MATSFAWLLAWVGFGAAAPDVLGGIPPNATIALFLIPVSILILGLFIEAIPSLIIFTPVLLTVILGLGIGPVFFGVVLIMAVVIGAVTPPVGILTYICCSIAGITISQALRVPDAAKRCKASLSEDLHDDLGERAGLAPTMDCLGEALPFWEDCRRSGLDGSTPRDTIDASTKAPHQQPTRRHN